MSPLNTSFFKFLFGFVGILAVGFLIFFAANYYDIKKTNGENAAAVELAR